MFPYVIRYITTRGRNGYGDRSGGQSGCASGDEWEGSEGGSEGG